MRAEFKTKSIIQRFKRLKIDAFVIYIKKCLSSYRHFWRYILNTMRQPLNNSLLSACKKRFHWQAILTYAYPSKKRDGFQKQDCWLFLHIVQVEGLSLQLFWPKTQLPQEPISTFFWILLLLHDPGAVKAVTSTRSLQKFKEHLSRSK